ncbi:unnamed protein product, partial [Durusdinium trenchii]
MLPGGMMPQMLGGPMMPQMYGGMMPQQMFHPPQSQVGEGDTYTSEDEHEQVSSSSTVPPKAAGIPLQQESSAVTAAAELQEDGITKYSEFTSRMNSSHRRILQNVSQDVFNSQVVNKFSLVLTDENIRAIACDLGWQDEWLITN